jgi:UrcA family protein
VFDTHLAGNGDRSTNSTQERIMTTIAKSTQLRRAFAVAAAFTALSAAATSQAAMPGDDTVSVTVRYDDLNLSSPAGVNALYSRISAAARQVCPDSHSRDLGAVLAAHRCQVDAVAKAVSEINSPQLAMVHAARVSRG